MPTQGSARGLHYLILLLAGFFLFFPNLGNVSLWDVDEGRNATAALEMLATGDYVVPRFNSELRPHKPALLYWLQTTAYRLFGVNEFSARLPSALAALLALLVVYELARRMFEPTTGLLAGLVLAASPMLIGAARFANQDALLCLCNTLTLTLFWVGQRWRRSFWFAAMGAAAGLAILAKGPIGVVLPGAIVFLFLLWEGRLRDLLDVRLVLGLLTLFLVAAPWYIWVAVETKADFLRGFFLQHNVNRFLATMDNHPGFPGYYLVVLLMGMLPWSVFLGLSWWYGGWSLFRKVPVRFEAGWERAVDRVEGGEDRVAQYRLLWIWMATTLVFFGIAATKLPNYILPAVPPAAVLLARFLVRWQQGAVQPARGWIHASLCGLLLLGLGLAAGLIIAGGVVPLPALRGRSFPGLEVWAVLGIGPAAGALLAWRYLARGQRTGVVACVLATAFVFLGPLAGWATVAMERFKSPRALVAESGAGNQEEDLHIGGLLVDHLPSLNFYTGRDIVHFFNVKDAQDFLRYPTQVYLFLPAQVWESWAGQVPSQCRVAARRFDMYRHHDLVVVTNRP